MAYGKKLGVTVPEILLPAQNIDLKKWSVVACDQYTSQIDYWKDVENIVGDSPSTLHMIFPEVYLEEDGKTERISKINQVMEKYLEENILVPQKSGFIYVERTITNGQVRKGLMITVDLEEYDYNKGSQSLIRATEGTVLDRLPPRIKVRENACVELPHIMLLVDDPENTVIGPLTNNTQSLEKLYDFDLMINEDNIKGYKVEDENIITNIFSALENLADPETFKSKYQVNSDKGVLLFAVGDGNHSLATAKACWEQKKKSLTEQEIANHPARFALVELVNIYDNALEFEPIHRVVFDVNPEEMLDDMITYFDNANAHYKTYSNKNEMYNEVNNLKNNENSHVIPFITNKTYGVIVVNSPNHNLEVGTLQTFLNDYVQKNNKAKIDYIHGEDVVDDLGSKDGNIGFYLPPMDKHDLFKTVILDGALPRKTFSMGEAEEKRFYLECKSI